MLNITELAVKSRSSSNNRTANLKMQNHEKINKLCSTSREFKQRLKALDFAIMSARESNPYPLWQLS